MNLLGRGNDPKFWSEEVRNKPLYADFINKQLKFWDEKIEGQPIESLKYTEYKLYGVTGNRNIYEKSYFLRRCQLGVATVLSLIYPEEQKYIDYLHNLTFAILNEFTWCLPAHQPELLSNTQKDYIDLFCCETGTAMAEVYALLGDRLAPLLRARIEKETEERIIRPFIDKPRFPWWRVNYTGNWAAVCAGSIGMTAMLVHPECFDEIKGEISEILERFLSGFSECGMCDEGTHYWGYGFGHFVAYADMVRIFTNGEIDYFKRDRVKDIATYIQRSFLSGQTAISFSDCPRNGTYYFGTVHKLKAEYPDDVKVYSPDFGTYTDGCGRFCFFTRSVIWLNEDYYFNPDEDNFSSEFYDHDFQWLIKRTPNFGFAAKAGNNEEHHNHNDVGSFIVAKEGRQVFADLGGGTYNKQYGISELRYRQSEAASFYHSLPIIGAYGQRYGVQYKAVDVKYENGVFEQDMAPAYALPDLKSLKRSFTVTEDTVTVHDAFDYEGNETIIERFVLLDKAELSDGVIKTKNTVATFDNSLCQSAGTFEVQLSGHSYYLVDIALKVGVKEFTLTIK